MSFDKLIEKIINEGIRNGEFDDLEGQGQPVDLDTYFSVPEDLRVGFSVLKNAKVIPTEMEVLKEVNELKSRLEGCTDATERKELSRKLNDATLRFNLLMDSYRRRSKLG
jgi:hypothetical protein